MKPRTLGCLAGLLLCGVAAFALWRILMPPIAPVVPFSQLSPQEQSRRKADVQRLGQQLRDIKGSAQRKEHKPFTIVVTQEELNTLVQQGLEKQNAPLHDVSIRLDPDLLTLQGRVEIKGIEAPAIMEGNVSAQDNKLAFQAKSLKLRGFNAPEKYRAQAEKIVTDKLNDVIKEAPGRLNTVRVEAGQLKIEGVTD